jgi:hypothetical protein
MQTDPQTPTPAPPAPPPPGTPQAPPSPDERKAPGFPGEASPGNVPPHRDDASIGQSPWQDPRDARPTPDHLTGEVVGDYADPPPVPQRTFASFVIEQRNGGLHAEASDCLAQVVKAVQDHGKGGSVIIKIDIKPGSKGTNTLVVSDRVEVKVPQGDRPAALYFPDENGNLHRSDPRQQALPLRRVDVGPAADLRRVGGDGR